MNVEFNENYSKLSDLEPGQVAVSKDREKFFVCGYCFDKLTSKNIRVILDMNDLSDQYVDKRDMGQPIRILKFGDKFVCTR